MYFGLRNILGNEAPLHAGRETGAATSAQIRLLHFVDDLFGGHLFQRFFQRLVAVALHVGIDRARIGNAEILADHHDFVGIALVQRAGNYRDGLGPLAVLQLLENQIHLFRIEIFVEIEIHLHGRSAGAGAHAFDFFQRKRAGGGDFFIADAQALLHVRVKFVAATQHAGNVGADLNVIASDGLAAQHGVIRQSFGDLSHVQVQAQGDIREQLIAEEAEIILRVHHHGDQRGTLHGVASEQSCEFFFQCRRQLHKSLFSARV